MISPMETQLAVRPKASRKVSALVYIYALIDPTTRLVRYVGKSVSVKHRFWTHICTPDPNTHRGRWIQKLRASGLVPVLETLETINDPDNNKWQAREKYWIKWMRDEGYELTNIQAGGGGCALPGTNRERLIASFTPERRAAIAARNAARIYTAEMAERRRALKVSDETRAKLRAAFTPERRAMMSESRRGYKPTAETIAKMVAKIRGTKWTPERRAKVMAKWTDEKRAAYAIQLKNMNRKNTPETIAKMSQSAQRHERSPITGRYL
jgi:hypothetical protein